MATTSCDIQELGGRGHAKVSVLTGVRPPLSELQVLEKMYELFGVGTNAETVRNIRVSVLSG